MPTALCLLCYKAEINRRAQLNKGLLSEKSGGQVHVRNVLMVKSMSEYLRRTSPYQRICEGQVHVTESVKVKSMSEKL